MYTKHLFRICLPFTKSVRKSQILIYVQCALSQTSKKYIIILYQTLCRESRSLHKHPRLDKPDSQLTDVNEYAITVTNPQHVVVRGSIREKLPPGLTIKSSHIRIGESIGQGNIKKKDYLRKNQLSILDLLT